MGSGSIQNIFLIFTADRQVNHAPNRQVYIVYRFGCKVGLEMTWLGILTKLISHALMTRE